MKNIKILLACLAVIFTTAACGLLEDQTPEFISFRMNGMAGSQVTVLYSKQFVAGVDEEGITRVEIFGADTVIHTLPIDTIIDVRLERRLYIQAEPAPADTLAVDVKVDVDERNIFDRIGDLFPTVPWRFLYQFNTPFTDAIEVVI